MEGKANAALERAFAHWCGVGRAAVTIEAGQRGRDKRVRIAAPGTLPAHLASTRDTPGGADEH